MELSPITEGLPGELEQQLLSDERVYYFSFISFKGGCGSSGSKQDYWVALTGKRVIYKAKVLEPTDKTRRFVEKDAILPFEKISFIEVSEEEGSGCGAAKSFHLNISTSGGRVSIPLPTKEKGYEIRRIFAELQNNTP